MSTENKTAPVRIKPYRERKSSTLIIVALLMIWCLIPFYVMIVGAFKPSSALNLTPVDLNPLIKMSFKNFIEVFRVAKVGRAFVNSLTICVLNCLITSFVGMTAGYAFAKLKFAGKNALFILAMATMMLPVQVMMIPRYMVAKTLGITNTLYGVVLTSINASYAIFMCRQFIMNISKDLLDAARIDGCSEYGVFFRIVLAMSKPVIAALSVFTFIGSWNDFVWQNIMIRSSSLRTVTLMLAHLDGKIDIKNLGVQFAGAALSAIPMILIFFCFQNFFIKGLGEGAVKE